MTTGEGGMVTTDDDELAAGLRSLANQGRSDSGDWLEHDRLGFNYRMDELSAAVGIGQTERLDRSSPHGPPWPLATTACWAGWAA